LSKRSVALDDKYTQSDGDVYMSSIQALVRLPLMQRQRDVAAGLNTAGFVTGYRGSPIGTYDFALWAARKHLEANQIKFCPRSTRSSLPPRSRAHSGSIGTPKEP
jgi:indolepyruvate ferredoxin oxidoreductase